MTPLLPGALFVALGLPLAAGKIPPNRLYGFRTAATRADPTVWYAVNRATGIDLVVGGLVLLVAGYVLPPRSLVTTALLVLVVALTFAHGAHRARVTGSATTRTDRDRPVDAGRKST